MKDFKAATDLRKKIKKKFSLGTWIQIPSQDNVEILSNSEKLDWITFDLEHGNFNGSKLIDMIRAVEKSNKVPFVRLQSKNQKNISNLLDIGIKGLIIPMINNKDDVIKILNKALFPPFGQRGVGYTRSNMYGSKFRENMNFKPIIVAMVETKESLKNLDDILSLKYLDGVFIGPYDLSTSLGVTAKFKSKIFQDAVNKILNVCKKNKKFFGIHVVEPSKKDLSNTIKKGFKFIAFSTDAVLLERSINKYL